MFLLQYNTMVNVHMLHLMLPLGVLYGDYNKIMFQWTRFLKFMKFWNPDSQYQNL